MQQAWHNSTERLQVLRQLEFGLQFWCFDVNLSYERSLTPYRKSFIYQNQQYDFR